VFSGTWAQLAAADKKAAKKRNERTAVLDRFTLVPLEDPNANYIE
jgi:hypothetical protein